MPTITEAHCETPIVEDVDVLVCGGGPAGICAAIAAARSGARTRLLEVHGALGGIWTVGMLAWIIDAADKGGIISEIVDQLEQRGARRFRSDKGRDFAYDIEIMKLVLEDMASEAGVQLRYHTRVVAATRDSNNRLASVITESKSGREAWTARQFIDCTGDGDLGSLAGCGFDLGLPDTGRCQPMSLLCLLTGIHFKEIEHFVGGGWAKPKDLLRAEMERGGHSPSYGKPTLFRIRDDLFCLMANHEYGVSALDAQQITDATVRARAEIHRLVDGLRGLGDPWSDIRMVASGAQIGVREGRRIRGRYQVTVDDLITGARHEQGICRCTFGFDVHALDSSADKGIDHSITGGKPSLPYDIPIGSLIAKDVDGLMMAGRCISGDFLAHSSYRVTGDAAALGQAAGVAAALAAKAAILPQDLPWSDLRTGLEAIGHSLPRDMPLPS
ncbi:MAG: FAD-dependent oxidoreductase [Planctomycetota bacterium]|nr:FAD-dependent oxidoreductase [Planctomycetota bacterium]